MPKGTPPADADFLDLFALELGPDGFDAYLQRVAATAAAWFGADGVTLFLRSAASDTFVLAARHGEAGNLPESACFVEGQGVAGKAAATGLPSLLHGRLDGRQSPSRAESSIIAPLVATPGQCVGVMNIWRGADRQRFCEDDLKTASAVSQHLALAVSNARLVAQLEAAAASQASMARRLEVILDSLHAGVVATDLSGRVVQVNRRLLQMLGVSKDANPSWEEIAGALSPKASSELEACWRKGAAGTPAASSVEEPNGACLAFRASPVPGGGVAIFLEDITQEVRRERELERTKRLAEAGQMTAAIAHEIRNPLTGIIGAAQLLKAEAILEKAHKWASIIEEEAQGLDRLCNEFLEFAREPNIDVKPSGLNEIITKVMERMQTDFEAAGILAVFEPCAKPIVVHVDPHKIGQALRNLFRNAIDATPRGGKVIVRTSENGEKVTISVTDTGHGMSKDDLNQRLFTPFFTTKSQGTGLGLCNVRKIVEAHGGAIHATSQKGEGTTFVINLPIGEKAA